MDPVKFFNSFADFVEQNKTSVFRIYVYRRVFTPYETQKAFMDESMYEDPAGHIGLIRQCISLGNEDFLIGFQELEDEESLDPTSLYNWASYYKLSEIRLELVNHEMEDRKCMQLETE